MDTTKVQKAIDKAQEELNGQIDSTFKARRLNVVRTLDLASKALQRASDHLTVANEQAAKKDAAEAEPATQG